MPDSPKHSGFTLIEMLIAFTLLSITLMMVFAGLRIGVKAWKTGEARIGDVNQNAVFYQFVRHNFALIKAMPKYIDKPSSDEDIKRPLVFAGFKNALTYVAPLPQSALKGGLQIFELYRDKLDPSRIMLRATPYYPEPPSVDESVELINGVDQFEISYFGVPVEGDAPQWFDEWAEVNRLPLLIRMRIGLMNGQQWPEIVVRLNDDKNIEPSS